MKRLAHLSLVLLLIASLGGCVWLRLLALKNQLGAFDENFATEVSDHYALIFKNPVLLNGDFVELAKIQPTRRFGTPDGGSRWIQAFHMLDAKGKLQPGKDFFFTLDFNQDDYLTRWDFSPLFMTMVPAQFFEASIRSIAKTKVDEANHRLKLDRKDWATITVKPPTVAQITAALGEPLEKTEEDGKKAYVYRFQVETPHIEPGYEDRGVTEVRLLFDPKTDEMTNMRGRFIGLKVKINMVKPD